MAALSALIAGVLFALGLGLGGMTDARNVRGFLDVTGDWDPSLAFVMGGALTVYGLARRWVLRREKPVAAPQFPQLSNLGITRPLLIGSALFGIGWGLSGLCPGPAIVTAGHAPGTIGFFTAMLGGFWLANLAPIKR